MSLFVICKNERETDIIVSNHIMSSHVHTVVSKLFDKGLETRVCLVPLKIWCFLFYEKENGENLFGELILVENCTMIKNKTIPFFNVYKENKRTQL